MKTPENLLRNTMNYRKTKKGILTNIYSHQKGRYKVDYTLKELHAMFIDNYQFNRLYIEWVKSGFCKQFKPTIDRVFCKRHYTLRNIHCLNWADNRYKQRMELKLLRARPVYRILNNTVVRTYKSVSHAVQLTGLQQSGISMCLNGHRNYCGGFKWSYENPELKGD